jgi:hypothetical protein
MIRLPYYLKWQLKYVIVESYMPYVMQYQIEMPQYNFSNILQMFVTMYANENDRSIMH